MWTNFVSYKFFKKCTVSSKIDNPQVVGISASNVASHYFLSDIVNNANFEILVIQFESKL